MKNKHKRERRILVRKIKLRGNNVGKERHEQEEGRVKRRKDLVALRKLKIIGLFLIVN